MGILNRRVFREIASGALLGAVLFTFVLFLQRIGRLFELLVRSSASPSTVAELFALVLPPTLPFTVPIGVLVGILLGLSRMSSDGEITAMRAAGAASAADILTLWNAYLVAPVGPGREASQQTIVPDHTELSSGEGSPPSERRRCAS